MNSSMNARMKGTPLTSRLQGFKARVQEEAGKVLRNWDWKDRRVFEQTWAQPKRSLPLWSQIANGV
jgi:hypothetical protein